MTQFNLDESQRLLDIIVFQLYNRGDYKEFSLSELSKVIKLHERDFSILSRQLIDTGLVEYKPNPNEDPSIDSIILRLSDKGILELKKHGTYSGYLAFNSKEQARADTKGRNRRRWERFERIPKVFWPLTGIGIFLMGLLPLVFPLVCKNNNSQQQTQSPEKNVLKSDTTKAFLPK